MKEILSRKNDIVVDGTFVLTEEVLKRSPERKGEAILLPKFVPIEQVRVPWITKAAESVYPITNRDHTSHGTIFHYRDNIWVTNHHCIYFQRGFSMKEKLRASEIYTNPPVSLRDAEYTPKNYPGYDHRGKGDVIVVRKGTPSVPPLYTGVRHILPREKVSSVMIGFPHRLSIEKGPYISYGSICELHTEDSIHGVCHLRNEPGNSGSPLFDREGDLIGIFSGSFQSVKRIEELVQELRSE